MEKFSVFMNGVLIGVLISLFVQWLTIRKLKRERRPPPHRGDPEGALKEFIDHLKKTGIPFEVVKGPGSGPDCPCPVCVAKRESEKTSGGDRVLH